MGTFDTINRSTPDDDLGDSLYDTAGKINDNTAKTANITEENSFLKKQTIKAATADGSKAFIILDLNDVEVGYITDQGKLVLVDDINAAYVQPLTNYKSVDGTVGATQSLQWRDADSGADLTLTVKNGIVTSFTTNA